MFNQILLRNTYFKKFKFSFIFYRTRDGFRECRAILNWSNEKRINFYLPLKNGKPVIPLPTPRVEQPTITEILKPELRVSCSKLSSIWICKKDSLSHEYFLAIDNQEIKTCKSSIFRTAPSNWNSTNFLNSTNFFLILERFSTCEERKYNELGKLKSYRKKKSQLKKTIQPPNKNLSVCTPKKIL